MHEPFRQKWWPVRLRLYPYAAYGWLHMHYLYYQYVDAYADRNHEHEFWLGKFCFSFGVLDK